MSELEILDSAIHILGNVSVPVGWIESIGIPLHKVAQNLLVLKNMLLEKKEQPEPENSSEPVEG